ncbi:SMP-30/gluconolactonase/LRE family protein [Pseudokordiimonas caeni]|uniref:SMP-30/gluconolactonase/LRE family protein n=1 Tax=Pseudokordiimonas caeni TaxID=2997908 RepID=UPI00281131E0|nr:SMP-30/gluconolactonase/LRE family protein [Pseudokordiimonas caeni]
MKLHHFLVAFAALILAFIVWPSPIAPEAYDPPADPGFTGPYALNDALQFAEVLPLKDGAGPEDVAVDGEGRIYGGLQDGRIVRLSADGKAQETFATIEGGRPLGLAFDAAGNLIVADAYKGLVSVAPDGSWSVLTDSVDGKRYGFTDDLDIASDGKIYFSDASDLHGQRHYRLDLLEAMPRGRLIVYDPAAGEAKLLLDGLYFANGIALSQNEDFVLVNETGRYRITRYWLKGDKAGTSDIFIDNLPGFPDGVSANRKGTFWLALASPRNPMLDKVHPKPWAKALLAKLPASLQPSAIRHGMVVGLNEDGKVIAMLHDPEGKHLYMITSVEEAGGYLYLGSLEAPQIGRIAPPRPFNM